MLLTDFVCQDKIKMIGRMFKGYVLVQRFLSCFELNCSCLHFFWDFWILLVDIGSVTGQKNILTANDFVKQLLEEFTVEGPLEFADVSNQQKNRLAVLCSANYAGRCGKYFFPK